MRKVGVLAILFVMILLGVAVTDAQQPKKIPRIGFLSGGYMPAGYLLEPLSHALRQLGYTDLKDFVVEMRGSGGDDTLLARQARERSISK